MKPETKSAHTPGPWKLRGRTIYGKTPSGRIVTLHSGWDESFEANSHLLVLAPELLESIKFLLKANDCLCDDPHSSEFKNFWVEALSKAHAAIAKAEI